ncbi:type I-D CRISPR-associated protein Cas10d/Csc3 [Thermoleptolyngbya oregonensis NK1-22]|uniref:Type I-D CRISPR-associated protein Cas10d/Csc3 n=1 Tax=Thermoleptolyngbya oregonensis NK1-22 TaxID=2547457 RepID=A0AA96Y573_9CYAN|nr:type I-D CRISPR-associated protein Cas10d/Csc3 [Thermoleptolyngbya oregonensis]WOB43709.1 type I-D CRISPR-associated protein Cas10d/Csc3 [Thermoleptolyngbya oregonensis NK1-22]
MENPPQMNDEEQLSLLNPEDEDVFHNLDESWLEDDFGFDQPSDRSVEPAARELLTLKLLREAIQAQNPDDAVMRDFAAIVLPNLLKYTIGVTAKGGKFFAEYLDRVVNPKRIAKGKEPIRRDNAADQSLNTHLLNGLFPANLIERRLQRLDTTVSRQVKERERRLLVSGFILHDFEKFDYDLVPGMPEDYKTIRRDPEQDIRKQPIAAHRKIITVLVEALKLDRFICSDQPEQWEQYLDDLLFLAYNAQRRNDTNLNLSDSGLNPALGDRTLRCLADLTCLADRLASVIKHPQDAENTGLYELIHGLSDGQLRLTYHAISENRGVLTNVVNNALMDAHISLNTSEQEHYTPLLYLPTGVIYLVQRAAPAISLDTLPNRVVASIKDLCAGQLRLRQTGFGRDGKGMKYADYYTLFFDDLGLMQVAQDATFRILTPNKESVASKRSENLIAFQQQGVLSADYDFTFKDDIRIDQLAEFGDLISRKIWGDRVNKLEAAIKERAKERKKHKDLPNLPAIDDAVLPENIICKVAEFWGLSSLLPQIREIQRINEKLKELKLKGNTGGVPYEWYFLAARFLQQNPGIEDLRETCSQVITYVADLTQMITARYPISDGWEDLRQWVGTVVMLPSQASEAPISEQVDVFLKELNYYNAAKKPGRGRQMICSISHSPYSVSEQMESAVLFTPQVYTNKQHLGGSNAKRNISSIAGIEMMLRQILMNQTQAVGKRFEDGKYRYLYFYPTYYFTPETNSFLHKAYSSIAQTRFDTSIRNHFISKQLEANFGREKYQTVDAFLMDEDLAQRKQLPDDDPNFKRDRTFKLTYPENKPLTFYFMALPPGRDSTDTESWVMPSWLALAFPMILDVKTVVSESPIPPFTDGSEFEESVFLDSAPHAFRTLVGRDRFRLDCILDGWTDETGIKRPAPLNVLTAAYAIHMDVNAKQGKGGYDANWGRFTELARDIETSPLYVFSYLAKWGRGQKTDAPSPQKIRLYAHYFYPCFDPYATYRFRTQSQEEEWILEPESPLNHPKKLTELYRVFYRANKRYNPKSNAVLKPIDIAADTILKAETSMFHDEALVTVVAAEVFKLMDRVHASTAEGRWIISDREKERQAVLDFARYFVIEVFEKAFAGDRARLAGRQLNLIRDTCEFLYRLEQDKENQALKAKGELPQEEPE